MKSLDLLIIDIDDTFIYHRTVAIANKLFLDCFYSLFGLKLKKGFYTTSRSLFLMIKLIIFNFFRFNPTRKNIKKLFVFSFVAIYLYVFNFFRELVKGFKIVSCEKMDILWAKVIIYLGISEKEYLLSKSIVSSRINKKVLAKLNLIKKLNPKMKVLAITQSFSVKEDNIKDVLYVDKVVSNRFFVSKGVINGFRLNVKSGFDKKKIAFDYIKQNKAKGIGLFIEDYDDLELLKLKGIEFVYYKRKLRKFVKGNYEKISF